MCELKQAVLSWDWGFYTCTPHTDGCPKSCGCILLPPRQSEQNRGVGATSSGWCPWCHRGDRESGYQGRDPLPPSATCHSQRPFCVAVAIIWPLHHTGQDLLLASQIWIPLLSPLSLMLWLPAILPLMGSEWHQRKQKEYKGILLSILGLSLQEICQSRGACP